MKRLVLVWREDDEYSRDVIDWLRELERRTGKQPESIDPDRPDGQSFCQAYDVMEYPTILALDDDGRVLQEWPGRSLPLLNEVSYYIIEQ